MAIIWQNEKYWVPAKFLFFIEHVCLDYGLEKSGIQLAIISRH